MTSAVEFRDYVIVGAGPAGLQMGYYLSRRGRDYTILECGGRPGSFFETFPRNRQLISINKAHTGFDDPEIALRWDWNSLLSEHHDPCFTAFSQDYFPNAEDLVNYLEAFAKEYALAITFGCEVARIGRVDPGDKHSLFELNTADGRAFRCRYLVMATGFARSFVPSIPGIEHSVDYRDVPLDVERYRNARVMILGKGNSAFETADPISDVAQSVHIVSPHGAKLAWQTHYVGNLRAVNAKLLDTYQLKAQNTIIDGNVRRIDPTTDGLEVTVDYDHAMVDSIIVPVDHVITCTGFKIDTSPFEPECMPDLCYDEKFPSLTSAWEAQSVPNMFFAGTLMHGRDFRSSFSGFIHGFRYNIELLDRIFDVRHNGGAMPRRSFEYGGSALPQYLLARIHSSSSLFQQPMFFCDAIAVRPDGEGCDYYRDLTLDYVFDGLLDLGESTVVTLTMEYGRVVHPDPFNLEVHPTEASDSNFLHPVIRVFQDGPKRGSHSAEFHFMEDLENHWYQACYLEPFVEFLEDALSWGTVCVDELLAGRPAGYNRAARVVAGQ
ncbi:MAG: NAD(P)-binding domain-containing protein [Actinomycetota bacterium]